MARAGLGDGWKCLFANDFDRKKATTYTRNWGSGQMLCDDVRNLVADDLPGPADLAWASFPCQDLSLAGGGAGLKGERSGTFWPFWRLVRTLIDEGRPPPIIALENVCGALTSHGGSDFNALCAAMAEAGYRYGALIVDAAHFVPQSRPRLVLLAVRRDISIGKGLSAPTPAPPFHSKALRSAVAKLPNELADGWIWWSLDPPQPRNLGLADVIEDHPPDVSWHAPDQTAKLLSMMSDLNLDKVRAARSQGRKVVGTIYKRTRRDAAGRKVQRAEARFDDIAGCLRTPVGGSSRQLVIVVNRTRVRSRLISSRETARLMGLPDDYILPQNYNEAYHLTGDGVVVPVVRFLADRLLEPILDDPALRPPHAA
ncbi:MAG: DNA cytosine methyltransferase [Gammaproteobacteria bacterium]|nr:DNA cytosine methyltransferase [Gammaproteobacteria bacterium]